MVLIASSAGLAADTWQWEAVGRNSPPAGRMYLSAIWTGSEFLFWGGRLLTGNDDWRTDGFRYDPRTDNWKTISSAGAPDPRFACTAVWTGRELIIWGGRSPGLHEESYNTGARYNPLTDRWTPTSTVNAPARRDSHTAVWTGKEMIVWGGFSVAYPDTWNDGGRYDPATDTWRPLSLARAPNPRQDHSAVWTGQEMLVWGGRRLLLKKSDDENQPPQPYFIYPTDLGRYNPETDMWTTKYLDNPPEFRANHSAIWTGTEMIIWGGVTERPAASHELLLNDGARFNLATEAWRLISSIAAPTARARHIGLWTGQEMIILGGSGEGNSGARYNPVSDMWTPIGFAGAPLNSLANEAAWTGEGLLVFHDQLSLYFEPGMYARDQLPDLWQWQHFGENNPEALAAADPDHDGQDNLHEYGAGTEPDNATSRFTLRIEKTGPPGSIRLSFGPQMEDRTYQIQVSTNSASGPFLPWNSRRTQENGIVTLEADATDLARFYRVLISVP